MAEISDFTPPLGPSFSYSETIKSLMRPFIAVSFVLGTIVLYLMGKIEPQSILQITSIVIGFYFGERAALKRP